MAAKKRVAPARARAASAAAAPQVQEAFDVLGVALTKAWENTSAQLPHIAALPGAPSRRPPGPPAERFVRTYKLRRKAGKFELVQAAKKKAKPGGVPGFPAVK